MTAHRTSRAPIAAIAGLALAFGGLVAASPANAGPGMTTAAIQQPSAAVAQDPGWDYQSCAQHGVPARKVSFDSPAGGSTWATYWVDGVALAKVAPPSSSLPYTYVLPTVPAGEHRWQIAGKFEGEPTDPGELITTPDCPADPVLPTPTVGPRGGLNGSTIENRPECRVQMDGGVAALASYEYINGHGNQSNDQLEVRADDQLAESYVVPEGSARLGALKLGTGTHSVDLKVLDGGAQATWYDVRVPSCAARFRLQPTSAVVASGARLSATVSRVLRGERLSLVVSGKTIARAVATGDGTATLSGTVPSTFKEMSNRSVTVRGAASNRTGSTKISTVVPKTLEPTILKSTISRGDSQRVTITGLVPTERAAVFFGGRRISPSTALASSTGRYSLTFAPGTYPGRKTVTVRGHDSTRTGTVTFTLR